MLKIPYIYTEIYPDYKRPSYDQYSDVAIVSEKNYEKEIIKKVMYKSKKIRYFIESLKLKHLDLIAVDMVEELEKYNSKNAYMENCTISISYYKDGWHHCTIPNDFIEWIPIIGYYRGEDYVDDIIKNNEEYVKYFTSD